MRLLEVNTIKIEEAALTGESVPVEKDLVIPEGEDVGIGDRSNMAFASTNVTYGRALGVLLQQVWILKLVKCPYVSQYGRK